MAAVFELLDKLRESISPSEFPWAVYGITAIVLIKKAIKKITAEETFGRALKTAVIYGAGWKIFSFVSLYLLSPESFEQIKEMLAA